MPRLVFATRENVFSACEQLVIEGKVPTKLLVREKIGGGSFSTIQTHLTNWFETKQQGDFENVSGGISIPQSAHKLVIEWYKTIYIEIQKHLVNEQINHLQNEVERLENEIMGYEEIKGEMSAVKALNKDYLDKIDSQSKQIGQLELQLEIIKKEIEKLKK